MPGTKGNGQPMIDTDPERGQGGSHEQDHRQPDVPGTRGSTTPRLNSSKSVARSSRASRSCRQRCQRSLASAAISNSAASAACGVANSTGLFRGSHPPLPGGETSVQVREDLAGSWRSCLKKSRHGSCRPARGRLAVRTPPPLRQLTFPCRRESGIYGHPNPNFRGGTAQWIGPRMPRLCENTDVRPFTRLKESPGTSAMKRLTVRLSIVGAVLALGGAAIAHSVLSRGKAAPDGDSGPTMSRSRPGQTSPDPRREEETPAVRLAAATTNIRILTFEIVADRFSPEHRRPSGGRSNSARLYPLPIQFLRRATATARSAYSEYSPALGNNPGRGKRQWQ